VTKAVDCESRSFLKKDRHRFMCLWGGVKGRQGRVGMRNQGIDRGSTFLNQREMTSDSALRLWQKKGRNDSRGGLGRRSRIVD